MASALQTYAWQNVNVQTARQLREADDRLKDAQKTQQQPTVTALSAIVEERWQDALSYKIETGVDDDMIANTQQRKGEYSADKLAAILKQGGSKVFISLTGVKCRAAEAWIGDILSNDLQRCWALKPTPIPDVPPEMQSAIVQQVMGLWMQKLKATGEPMAPQQVYAMANRYRDELQRRLYDAADQRADGMQTLMHDQMVEAGWDDVFEDFTTDLVTLKAGIIKGPEIRRRRKLVWARKYGRVRPVVQPVLAVTFSRVSPFDAFPSRGAVTCDDGDFHERVRFSREALESCKRLPGYDDEAIDLVLETYGQDGLATQEVPADSDRADLEDKGDTVSLGGKTIEGREFWGAIQGKHLIERGIAKDTEGRSIERLREYQVVIIQIPPYVIYVNINPDLLGRRPYSKSGWGKIPGSFWYHGVPELMRDIQAICNATMRSLCNNMSIASGPQVVLNDIMRLAKGTSISTLKPWYIWQFVNKYVSQVKPVEFFQPDSNARELLGVYSQISQLADDFTGIPAYAYGNERAAGAGRTASGLSMLMNTSARGIKKTISRIDKSVMKPVLTRLYEHNMQFSKDESIKGDSQIVPQGALSFILREQMAARRLEFLNATANPLDQRIMGVKRRANLLRAAGEALEMPSEEVIPDKEEIEELEQQMAQESQLAQQLEVAKATSGKGGRRR